MDKNSNFHHAQFLLLESISYGKHEAENSYTQICFLCLKLGLAKHSLRKFTPFKHGKMDALSGWFHKIGGKGIITWNNRKANIYKYLLVVFWDWRTRKSGYIGSVALSKDMQDLYSRLVSEEHSILQQNQGAFQKRIWALKSKSS